MRIIMPILTKQTFQLAWENKKTELILTPFSNYIDLASFPLKPDTYFSLSCSHILLFQSSMNILSYLEQNMLINRACLCLDIFRKGESIYPAYPTNTFYKNDPQIVFWMEFFPVKQPVPLFISCWYNKQLQITINAYIPLLKDTFSKQDLVSYAAGFLIEEDFPSGEWLLKADLPTGKTIFQSKFKLLNFSRPDYGENTSLFPASFTGGKMINKLVE